MTPSTTPSPAPNGTAVAQILPSNTPLATHTSEPATPTIIPTNIPRAAQIVLEPAQTTAVELTEFDVTGEMRDHYWFARPFPRDPSDKIHDYASRNYAYGTTAGGDYQTHHGMDFQNSPDTSILAIAPGTVFYAGNDFQVQFGPCNNFYGNLVVIEHETLAPHGEPLYSLYGHMFRLEVATGDHVEGQQKIGSVGSTGVALGAHLHLEIRIGDPFDYANTYNPDLWLQPWQGFGTLAGRIWDGYGNRFYDATIIIQSESGFNRYTSSYVDNTVNPDPYYGEHFTYGDLPIGNYQVLVRQDDLRYKGEVTIEDGKTTWLEINVN